MTSGGYKLKAKGTFRRVCKWCGQEFEIEGRTQAQAERKNYCCEAHAKKASNAERILRARRGANMPVNANARVIAIQAAYGLEDDPWQSGRLPKTVTENQVFS